MNGATTEVSTAREDDSWRAKRQWAFVHFIEAFREVKKRRAHDNERKAVDALVDCVGVEDPKREAFHLAWTLLDRLVEDELGAWAELFQHAIEAGPLPENVWQGLKACQGDGRLKLVIMTRAERRARGPNAVGFYGDTFGLPSGFRECFDFSPAPHHVLSDGSTVFFIRDE